MAIPYCKVTISLWALVGDTSDPDDEPDRVPMTGSILFEPTIQQGVLVRHNNAGTIELLAIVPVEVQLSIDGQIHYEGNPWVKLAAPTLDDTNIENLEWKATFKNIQYLGTSITVNPITFQAIPDGEINIATVS